MARRAVRVAFRGANGECMVSGCGKFGARFSVKRNGIRILACWLHTRDAGAIPCILRGGKAIPVQDDIKTIIKSKDIV